MQTFPRVTGEHRVTLEPGSVVEGLDFGNFGTSPGSIHGVKWLDENGNGERDPGEPGLAGVTIFSDVNLNGEIDEGEPQSITMENDPETDFDETGLYWLEDLPPGEHVIREVVPDGFEQTFPALPAGAGGADGTFSNVSPTAINLVLDAGQTTVEQASITIDVLCIVPVDIDVDASAAPAGVVTNLTGVLTNGCGGDTSIFQIQFTGDGFAHTFDLEFVDPITRNLIDAIPVTIATTATTGAHVVNLGSGATVDRDRLW